MARPILSHDRAADSTESRSRVVRLVSVALAFVPYLATGLLLIFAWDTSRAFGAWPSYASPDPKSANTALYVTSGLAIAASLPSVFVLLIGLPIVRWPRLNRVDALLIAGGLAGLLILYTVFAGNLGDWYAD